VAHAFPSHFTRAVICKRPAQSPPSFNLLVSISRRRFGKTSPKFFPNHTFPRLLRNPSICHTSTSARLQVLSLPHIRKNGGCPPPHPDSPLAFKRRRKAGKSLRFILLQTLCRSPKSQLSCFQADPNSFCKMQGVGASQSEIWRRRVEVESTIRPAKDRIAGFEGRGSHRTPFASELCKPITRQTLIGHT
jgi:hypothetical protein